MKPKYEDFIDKVEEVLKKCQPKWTFTADNALSYEDVCQTVRAHIAKKLDEGLYDPSRAFEPWAYAICHNQIKNILKSKWSTYIIPCQSLRCAAHIPDDGCKIYGTPCAKCPLIAKWQNSKKYACDIKLPVAIENHIQETSSKPDDTIDLLAGYTELNSLLLQRLNKNQLIVYQSVYLSNLSDEDVAKKLGYKTTEKNRFPGYKNISDLKKQIIAIAKEIVYEEIHLK